MLVTVAGIFIVVRVLQAEKAPDAMVVTVDGRFTDVRLLQR